MKPVYRLKNPATMMIDKMNRRALIAGLSKTALGVATAPLLYDGRLFGGELTTNKLNIACIGLGGQMHNMLLPNLANLQDRMKIIAICDLDPSRIADTRKNFPQALAGAKDYQDYRKLLESEKSLDAVVIASPDHWHAILCKAALQAGKHVCCEKPLTHTVGEARQVANMAKRSKVVTQTGNQGSGSSNFRRSIEVIQAGVLGSVNEVHIWHPPHGWPNGVERPSGTDPVPDGFDWDFWTGPAPLRPFKQGIYHMLEWVEACRENGRAFSPFEIGGPITEIGAAGLLALRLGRDIDWDGVAMTAQGQPGPEAWIKAQQRDQWGS